MKELLCKDETIIFIDESSYGNNHGKFRTWINKRDTTEIHFPGRMPSMNLILATLPYIILHFKVREKSTKSGYFKLLGRNEVEDK